MLGLSLTPFTSFSITGWRRPFSGSSSFCTGDTRKPGRKSGTASGKAEQAPQMGRGTFLCPARPRDSAGPVPDWEPAGRRLQVDPEGRRPRHRQSPGRAPLTTRVSLSGGRGALTCLGEFTVYKEIHLQADTWQPHRQNPRLSVNTRLAANKAKNYIISSFRGK